MYTGSGVAAVSPRASSASQIIVIEIAVNEPIDENNSVVVDLVSAGYSVQESIDAVDKYGTLEAALSYLEMDDDDQEENGVILTSNQRQFSREDSQDSVIMDW